MPIETAGCARYLPMMYINKELQPFVRYAPKTRRDTVIFLRHRSGDMAKSGSGPGLGGPVDFGADFADFLCFLHIFFNIS